MPQLQLPIFPAGVTEINSRIAVQKDASTIWYIHGHLPVFQHAEGDVQSFRMFTSQMIAGGTVKPQEIVKTFGVPMITVKRYVKLYRDHVQGILRGETAPQFGVGAERGSAGASAVLAG